MATIKCRFFDLTQIKFTVLHFCRSFPMTVLAVHQNGTRRERNKNKQSIIVFQKSLASSAFRTINKTKYRLTPETLWRHGVRPEKHEPEFTGHVDIVRHVTVLLRLSTASKTCV